MKLMVIDGNSIVNRAFYGVSVPLQNREGFPTSAIYGFFTMLNRFLREETPDALCITFDEKAPTFRHKAYADYKGTRKKMPEDLALQLPVLRETLEALAIPYYSLEGWEADDLIGTIAKIDEKAGWETVIVTGDKDSLQLVSPLSSVLLLSSAMGRSTTKKVTLEVFQEEYAFPPRHIIDMKALMGDKSDNIPGIRGMGEKTVLPLVVEHHSIQEIYQRLEDPTETLQLSAGMLKKLREGEDMARLSYDLATIRCDAPIAFLPEDQLRQEPKKDQLWEILTRLELDKLKQVYGLQEMEAEIQAKALPTYRWEQIQDYDFYESWSASWGADTKISLLALPNLEGIALHTPGKEEGFCGIFLESSFSEYHRFLSHLFTGSWQILTHRSKYLQLKLLQEGISAKNITFDLELAGYLFRPDGKSYHLENLAWDLAGQKLGESSEYLAEGAFAPLREHKNSMDTWALHCVSLYGLENIAQEQLKSQGMWDLYQEIELPLCGILAGIEKEGISVNREALQAYGEKISQSLASLEAKIYQEAGEEFNLGSPKQMGYILFEKLELPPIKKTKTGYSTNVEVLEKLRQNHPDCPIISLIMEQRQLSKLYSTYVKGLLKELSPKDKIHTNFQNTVTATGRLSSTEPNLQNIPIRTALGAELRHMFTAEAGQVLVDADYSQIELRLLAHMSQDATMIQAFLDNVDIHSQTASQVFQVPLDSVSSEMRRSAKAVNFGIVYGMSAFALAEDIGVSVAKAKDYIDSYFRTYPGVKAYLDEIVRLGGEHGFVTTLFGRKRWLPDIKSSNFQKRSLSERMALNTPIQGTAADLIKKAMIAVGNRLAQENYQGNIVLQVHDELIIQCPKEEAEAVAALVKEEMEAVADYAVPLLAETQIGQNWGDAH